MLDETSPPWLRWEETTHWRCVLDVFLKVIYVSQHYSINLPKGPCFLYFHSFGNISGRLLNLRSNCTKKKNMILQDESSHFQCSHLMHLRNIDTDVTCEYCCSNYIYFFCLCHWCNIEKSHKIEHGDKPTASWSVEADFVSNTGK